MSLIPGLGRFPGGGHGNPLQYPCLEKPMDRGAWRATVHGVSETQTKPQPLSTCTAHSPGAASGRAHLPMWRPGSNPWVRKIPWRRKWWPTPVFLPGKFHGQRNLEVYSPWGSQKVGHDRACTHHVCKCVYLLNLLVIPKWWHFPCYLQICTEKWRIQASWHTLPAEAGSRVALPSCLTLLFCKHAVLSMVCLEPCFLHFCAFCGDFVVKNGLQP